MNSTQGITERGESSLLNVSCAILGSSTGDTRSKLLSNIPELTIEMSALTRCALVQCIICEDRVLGQVGGPREPGTCSDV
jgi:hypothetical protein